MAKGQSSKSGKEQELRWRAESIVREAVEQSPNFGKAVRQTIKELKTLQKDINQTLKNKKK